MPTFSPVAFKSPLHKMTQSTPTCLWNDSASLPELTYAIEHGAVGATCNPVIALGTLKKEMATWRGRIQELVETMRTETESEIGWRIVEEMSVGAAKLLEPIFQEQKGRNGRLSIQTDPRYFRNTEALTQQAVAFDSLAPNIVVKLPATYAGIVAIEEATYRGVTINATVSFTVPQAIAVAEAVERGLRRREAEGKNISPVGSVCTIMVGRVDDWLKVSMEKQGLSIDPGFLEWAGVAVFKRAYQIYRQRGYRTRLLSAAFRNHMHWSEFIGGDVVISPPYAWQLRYSASDIEVVSRIDKPVDPRIVDTLHAKFSDFRRAHDEGAMAPVEFDAYAPTRKTLRQFLAACHYLEIVVRDVMVSNRIYSSSILLY